MWLWIQWWRLWWWHVHSEGGGYGGCYGSGFHHSSGGHGGRKELDKMIILYPLDPFEKDEGKRGVQQSMRGILCVNDEY